MVMFPVRMGGSKAVGSRNLRRLRSVARWDAMRFEIHQHSPITTEAVMKLLSRIHQILLLGVKQLIKINVLL